MIFVLSKYTIYLKTKKAYSVDIAESKMINNARKKPN